MKFKKILTYIIFFAFLILALYKTNDILKFKFNGGHRIQTAFNNLPKDSVDILFIGTSHIYYGINPAVFWDQAGIPAFDLATSSQPIANTYHLMEYALKTQKPKVVVVDLYKMVSNGKYFNTGIAVKAAGNIKDLRIKYNSFRDSVNQENIVDTFLGYPLYHSRYQELERKDFIDEDYDLYAKNDFKGQIFSSKMKQNIEFQNLKKIKKPKKINARNKEYLDKMIALANKYNVKLEFMIVPYPTAKDKHQGVYLAIEQYLKEKGIDFNNDLLNIDDIGFDYTKDFADNNHLSYIGKEKYSKYILNRFQSKYKFENRQGDEKYSSWQSNADKSKAFTKKAQMLNEDNIVRYLELSSEFGYDMVLRVNGEAAAASEGLQGLLMQLGVEERDLGKKGILVKEGDAVSFLSKDYIGDSWYKQYGKDILSAVVLENENVIGINETNLEGIETGIDIVLYDSNYNLLIETASFDMDRNWDKRKMKFKEADED